jgi:thioredoxin-dependent peroxiredoxin
MAKLEVDSPAPDATITLDDGSALQLSAIYAKGATLVYFYPKSGTPGCTRQACNLRDNFAVLSAKGVQVIGVSRDSVKAQTAFREKQKLPFRLAADPEGKLGDIFGVGRLMFNGYARQTFLIVGGKVAWKQERAKPDTQAADALKAFAELA